MTSDEIYEAEKYGADLLWPGSAAAQELEEQEALLNAQLNNNGQDLNMSHGGGQGSSEYSATNMRHPSQQSLSNASNSSNPAESGYCQSSADETMSVGSSYTISQTPNPIGQSLSSSSSTTSQARPTTASHHGGSFTTSNAPITPQHYSSQSQELQQQSQSQSQSHQASPHPQTQSQQQQHHHHSHHHHQQPSQQSQGTPKKTNMSKCTSMSDYTLYNNGNGNGHYRPPMSPTQSEYNFDTETVASTIASHRHSAQFDNAVNYRSGHHRTSSMSNQNSRFLPKGGRNRVRNLFENPT